MFQKDKKQKHISLRLTRIPRNIWSLVRRKLMKKVRIIGSRRTKVLRRSMMNLSLPVKFFSINLKKNLIQLFKNTLMSTSLKCLFKSRRNQSLNQIISNLKCAKMLLHSTKTRRMLIFWSQRKKNRQIIMNKCKLNSFSPNNQKKKGSREKRGHNHHRMNNRHLKLCRQVLSKD